MPSNEVPDRASVSSTLCSFCRSLQWILDVEPLEPDSGQFDSRREPQLHLRPDEHLSLRDMIGRMGDCALCALVVGFLRAAGAAQDEQLDNSVNLWGVHDFRNSVSYTGSVIGSIKGIGVRFNGESWRSMGERFPPLQQYLPMAAASSESASHSV
jgi:hypothetical protein